jgi:ribosomal-protein-alanine N-acetyltransferase
MSISYPRLKTARMLLRIMCEGDRAEFVRINQASAEHFRPWLAARPEGQTLEAFFDERLKRTMAGVESGSEYRFVGELGDGRIAGFFALSQVHRGAFLSAMAGWSVSADVCGRGLATEGVGALLEFAFAGEPEGLGLHRVQANIIPRNIASVRVAEKNGFRLEGIGRRYLRINGKWEDHGMYAKTVEEQVKGGTFAIQG